MSMRNPKLIRDLSSIDAGSLNPDVLVELETATGNFKGTIADLFTAMGDQFISGDTLRLLLSSKMNVGGAADDTIRFNGKTEADWRQIIAETPAASADNVGGLTANEIATKDEVAQVASDLEQLAGIIQALFDSLNGSNP